MCKIYDFERMCNYEVNKESISPLKAHIAQITANPTLTLSHGSVQNPSAQVGEYLNINVNSKSVTIGAEKGVFVFDEIQIDSINTGLSSIFSDGSIAIIAIASVVAIATIVLLVVRKRKKNA